MQFLTFSKNRHFILEPNMRNHGTMTPKKDLV